MADRHNPRRGSMGFSPRKRAIRPYGRITSWPESDATEIRVQGFAGWKAGMTHVLMRDTNPNSTSAGQEVRKAVTVVEVPPMKVLAVRGYHDSLRNANCRRSLGEFRRWANRAPSTLC